MADRAAPPWRRLGGVLGHLPPAMLALTGVLVLAGVAGGGYFAYRTYDYVQHDNEFCMSCHLMAEPFEQFARSAHQGLGCKACHRPNLLERSRMGLTAFVDDPQEVSAHAAVPNGTCAECHIEGDPERWRSIANTVGHRVHLESDELEGLQCVQCHATSIHEFAPSDRTCSQAGCHEDNTVRLGEMGDLAIHCAACHTFVAPTAERPGILGSELDAAILPDWDECLACHAMRTLMRLPDPDPHEGGCAACHNPHVQASPAEAAESCASAGCHSDAVDLTPFHRGLEAGVTEDCLYCHQAHDFALDGTDCASCHEGAELRTPTGTALDFGHDEHQALECGSCHAEGERHGASSVTSVEDCRSCHHTPPVSASCEACHRASDAPTAVYEVTRSVSFSVGAADPSRALAFPHASHSAIECSSCHTEGSALAPADDLDCQSCHDDHHTPESLCASCHRAAPVSAHPPEEGHVTCSGAGCHQRVPFEGVPRTRAFCLGCHQDLTEHEPARVCADCHTLPAPRVVGNGGRR